MVADHQGIQHQGRMKSRAFRQACPRIEHDPEKHALGPRPDGWEPVFPRDKREAFARRSCSNKKIERDDDSKKSRPALKAARLRSLRTELEGVRQREQQPGAAA